MIFGVDTATVIVSTSSAIIVSVVGIFLSSKLTGRRIRDQAKWDRAVSAYNDVLGSLSELRRINGEVLHEGELEIERSESYNAHRIEVFRQSMTVIRRASESADLHMSSKTKDALKALIRIYDGARPEDDWYEALKERKEAVINAIYEISKEAESAWKSR